jgi:hypothetical protein
LKAVGIMAAQLEAMPDAEAEKLDPMEALWHE